MAVSFITMSCSKDEAGPLEPEDGDDVDGGDGGSSVTYSVTYSANGGTGSVTDPSSPYTDGSTVTVLAALGISRSGYNFLSWNTSADGSGTTYAEGASYTANAAVTLYARWTQEPTCTVTYNGNGNTGGAPPTDGNAYLQGDTVTVTVTDDSSADHETVLIVP